MSAAPRAVCDPAELDAARVERALRAAGVLGAARVTAVEAGPVAGSTWSRQSVVRVTVDGEAPDAPRALRLKMCEGTFGPAEVHYYTRDYAGLEDAPLPRCFDAAYEPEPRRYHVLIEDLSDSHVNGDSVPPSAGLAASLGRAFALLHAHRWGESRLATIGVRPPGGPEVARDAAEVTAGLEPLIASAGEALPPGGADRLRAMAARFAAVRTSRARDPEGLALVHGDPNPGNLLVPRDGAGSLRLIDHQPFEGALPAWLAASDLALAMVPWWEPAARRAFEPEALRTWHATLVERGVREYPFTRACDDYRLAMGDALALPLRWCASDVDRERMRWLWTRQLARALEAWRDWDADRAWRT